MQRVCEEPGAREAGTGGGSMVDSALFPCAFLQTAPPFESSVTIDQPTACSTGCTILSEVGRMPVKPTVKELKRELDGKEFVDEGVRWRVHDVLYDASLRTHMVLYADVHCRYMPPRPEDLESSSVHEVRAWIEASSGGGPAADVVPCVSPTTSEESPEPLYDDASGSSPAPAPAQAPAPAPAQAPAPAPVQVPLQVPVQAPAPAPAPAPGPIGGSASATVTDDARAKRLARLKRQLGDTLGTGTQYYRKYKACVQSTDGTPTSTPEFRKRLYER